MNNTTDIASLLYHWNSMLSTALLPDTIFLSICIVIGICGNVLVILVYMCKFRGYSERYFVPYLAIADVLALCETAGFNISYNMKPVMYDDHTLCRWSWFVGYLLSLISIFLLLVIAVQRYMKICRPHGEQMTLKWRRCSLWTVFIVSLGLSVPTLFIYGLDQTESDMYHVTGRACRRLTKENRGLSLGHSVVINLAIFAVVWSLVIMYSLIGRVFVSHINRKKRIKISKLIDKTKGPGSTREGNSRQYKTTLMFLLISVIFMVSYAPKVVIFIFECVNERFWDTLTVRTRLVVRFFDTMFIINNLSNPFVYAILDVKFIKVLKGYFCRPATDN